MLPSSLLLLALQGCATGDGAKPADYRFDAEDPASLEDADGLAEGYVAQSDKYLVGVGAWQTVRIGVDGLGMAHVRLQQEIDGVPVLGGEAIVHLNADGSLFGVTDDMVRDLDVDTEPLWSDDEALDIALDAHGGGRNLKHDAQTDLFVLRIDDTDHLAWRVRLADMDRDDPSMPVYFVDAHDGTILKQYDDLKAYSLSDADKITYNLAGGTRTSRATVGSSTDADLLTTHNSIASTLAFYQAKFGRDSYDTRGAVVKSYGHYSRNYVNAYWDGTEIMVGDGDGVQSDYLGVLDVMAHEFSHAVSGNEANFTYANESGALDEANSDIFAAGVEAYVDGAVTSDTWDIGEDCWLAAPALRYMSHPSDDGSSKDYYPARYTGGSDNGGVHWNSGIANYFFYLLSEGGQHHTASYRTGTVVTGIGIDAALQIWYLAMTSYMTSSTDFAGAAAATQSACSALGYSSTTCDSVTQAWAEVGVGTTSSGGGSGACSLTCSGGTLYSGSLTSGASAIEPGGTYFYAPAGTHGTLCGPSGTDFDLYLYYSTRTSRFKSVASSTGSASSESVSYGSAGYYYYNVKSYSGSGTYQLCIQ